MAKEGHPSFLLLVRRGRSLLMQQGPNVRLQSKQLRRTARSDPNYKTSHSRTVFIIKIIMFFFSFSKPLSIVSVD